MMKNNSEMPRLYRGDSDPHGVRKLKDTITMGLFTNLINGGNPSEIYNSLSTLINKHVKEGWETTHFLSFSEREQIAEHFGLGENHDADRYALIQLNPEKFKCKELKECGMYKCVFGQSVEIILINVVECIEKNNLDILDALSNAKRDSEWLVLPITKIYLHESNSTENTALLDMDYDVLTYNWMPEIIDQTSGFLDL